MREQTLAVAVEQAAEGADRAPRTGADSVVILDFGSQYSMLIARRVRECGVYCELLPHDAPAERVAALRPKGFILSGGPASASTAWRRSRRCRAPRRSSPASAASCRSG